MRAQDAMTGPALTCSLHDTLETAAHGMLRHDYGCVVVLDDENRCVGMLTLRDVVRCAADRRRRLVALRVEDAMSRPVRSCAPLDRLAQAESVMQMFRVRRLPVLDPDRRVLGLLSLDDIARVAAHTRVAGTSSGISLAGVGATLAMICEPRRERDQPVRTYDARGLLRVSGGNGGGRTR